MLPSGLCRQLIFDECFLQKAHGRLITKSRLIVNDGQLFLITVERKELLME